MKHIEMNVRCDCNSQHESAADLSLFICFEGNAWELPHPILFTWKIFVVQAQESWKVVLLRSPFCTFLGPIFTYAAATVYHLSCCLVTLFIVMYISKSITLYPCTSNRYWYPMWHYIAIVTHNIFTRTFIMTCYHFSIISPFSFSMHRWEGPVGK